MDHGLLIAQIEHGPQMHGPVLLVLVGVALVVGVVALVRKAIEQKRSHRATQLVRHENAPDRERP